MHLEGQLKNTKLANIACQYFMWSKKTGTRLTPCGSDISKQLKAEGCFGLSPPQIRVIAGSWHTTHTCGIPRNAYKKKVL